MEIYSYGAIIQLRQIFIHLNSPSFRIHFCSIFPFAPLPPGQNPRYPRIGHSGAESAVKVFVLFGFFCGNFRVRLRLSA
jgi:hypothetical protein